MKKTAIITGASSGIGKAIAHALAVDKYRLILIARREEKLEDLKKDLLARGVEVLSLCFDVRDKQAVKENLENLDENWSNIDVLVNNAGLAVGLDPIGSGLEEDWDRMMDTNVKGLLYVSRAVLPYMIKQNRGHVINIGSIAGKEVYPNGVVYCASKHAVDAISRGMRMDHVAHNIKVTQVCPGAVETEFSVVRFKGDQQRADNVYKGFAALAPEDIANVVSYCLGLPDHVCINDIVVMPTAQASAGIIHRQ